jgi:hypothetical protein
MANKYDAYNAIFNSEQYKTSEFRPEVEQEPFFGGAGPNTLGKTVTSHVDASDLMANVNKMVISFQHAPTERSVYFKAFITAFNEAYTSKWTTEEIYGRTDPSYMFKNTTRKITLAFKIPAASESEAYENLGKVSKLAKFMYPSYTDIQGTPTITQSPLIRIKIMNLLQTTANNYAPRLPGQYQTSRTLYFNYTSNPDSAAGLLGVVENITINHNLHEEGALEKEVNTILPKLIDVNITFAPIHEHPLGWDAQSRFGLPASAADPDETAGIGSNTFPYGVTLNDPAATAALLDTETAGDVLAILEATKESEWYQQALEDEYRARYRGWAGGELGDASRMEEDFGNDPDFVMLRLKAESDRGG